MSPLPIGEIAEFNAVLLVDIRATIVTSTENCDFPNYKVGKITVFKAFWKASNAYI